MIDELCKKLEPFPPALNASCVCSCYFLVMKLVARCCLMGAPVK